VAELRQNIIKQGEKNPEPGKRDQNPPKQRRTPNPKPTTTPPRAPKTRPNPSNGKKYGDGVKGQKTPLKAPILRHGENTHTERKQTPIKYTQNRERGRKKTPPRERIPKQGKTTPKRGNTTKTPNRGKNYIILFYIPIYTYTHTPTPTPKPHPQQTDRRPRRTAGGGDNKRNIKRR